MRIMFARILLLSITFSFLGCNGKRENIQKLFNVENQIDIALKSSDTKIVQNTIIEIEKVELIFPEQQNLKEKKYTLQIRLKKYEDAISTIDDIIDLFPDDIDNRIIQGILLIIVERFSESNNVLNTALEKIETKISKGVRNDITKELGLKVNRILILKLLDMDSVEEYNFILNDPALENKIEIKNLLLKLQQGTKEQIINNYR